MKKITNNKSHTKYQIRDTIYDKGQAMIMFISFVAIAIVVISGALINMFINTTAATRTQVSDNAYSIAESGAENALLQLLRDPTYAGETLVVGTGSAVVTVTGTNPKTIISTGTFGTFVRKITVVASDSAGILSVTSWKEQ